MKINDIITLTQAGWTKDEIMQLVNSEQPEQPAPEQPEQPAPEQPEQPAPEQKPDDDKIKQLETKLDYVINRFNYMAVQQSSQPQGKEESLDDILASVVRGFQKDEKK